MTPSALCPLPGIGTCVDAPTQLCGLRPGAGRVVDRHLCPGPSFACVETMVGPDGVTAADRPHGSLASGTVTLTFTDPDAAARGDTKANFKCVVDGVRDAAGQLVTTSFAGTCHDGPKAGVACGSSVECDTEVPPRFFCVAGDEYFCRFKAIRVIHEHRARAQDEDVAAERRERDVMRRFGAAVDRHVRIERRREVAPGGWLHADDVGAGQEIGEAIVACRIRFAGRQDVPVARAAAPGADSRISNGTYGSRAGIVRDSA